MSLSFLSRWRRRELRHPEPEDWQGLLEQVPTAWGLTPEEGARLREMAGQFLRDKHLEAVGGLVLDAEMAWLVAIQACVPVLNLGLGFLDNWRTIILYPDGFIPAGSVVDEAGVFHARGPHMGEAWPNGPIVISWGDVERDLGWGEGDEVEEVDLEEDGECGECGEVFGYPLNVILHEVAHQLDVRSGEFDGMPPLHGGMAVEAWIRDFTRAEKRLRRAVARGGEVWLDPYALESPAEFFAVSCETFFLAPEWMMAAEPALYGHLRDYFRQDPLARLSVEEEGEEGEKR